MDKVSQSPRPRRRRKGRDEAADFIRQAVLCVVKDHGRDSDTFGGDDGDTATLLATHLRGAARCCELIAAHSFRREGLVDAAAEALARADAVELAEAQRAAEDAVKTEVKGEEGSGHATQG